MRNLLAVFAAFACCHAALSQTYTLVSQTRTVDTFWEGCGDAIDADSAQAQGAEPFDVMINSGTFHPFPVVFATQDSHFESRFLVGSGNAGAGGGCGCGSLSDCQSQSASSIYEAKFALAHPTRFHLISNISGPGPGSCRTMMSFSGPAGVIVSHTHFGTDDLLGELGPGEHNLVVHSKSCWGTCMGCGNGPPSSYEFSLELRRFGDAQGDSNVDVDDLLAVINNWGQCPSKEACEGDLNASGVVDVDDLLEVINHWD